MLTKRHLAPFAILLAAATAFATRPGTFTHQTERDFADGGNFDNTVINSYGELTLGRELKPIATPDAPDTIVALALASDNAVYAAIGGPDSKILRVADGKAKPFYDVPERDGDITALAADAKGNLLLAVTDGKQARLLKLTPGDEKAKPATVFQQPSVENIWAIRATPDGSIYLGTGPKGQIHRIPPEGKPELVLDAAGRNILTLAFDKQNRLIAGTDGSGLVLRVENKKPFVLHEAGEGIDVTSLAVDDDGNIYAGTARGEGSGLGGFNFGDDTPGTKSKPGKVDPDEMEIPDDEVPTPGGAKKPAPPRIKPPKTEPGKEPKPKTPATKPMMQGDAAQAPLNLLPLGRTYFIADHPGPKLSGLLGGWGPMPMKNTPPTTRPKPPVGTLPGNKKKHTPPHGLPSFGGMLEEESANAVVRIAPDNSVSTVVSTDDMVMSLLWHKGPHGNELLIGTGPEGKIYAYNPDDESQSLIARIKEDSVTALTLGNDAAVYLGASDLGQLYTLAPTLAPKGTYVSKVLDASRPAAFGQARANATAPAGTSATLATRTGNVADILSQEKFWSPWSDELPATDAGGKIASPGARYLQYRITLTGDGKEATPTVDAVKLSFEVKNLPPRVKNLIVEKNTPLFEDETEDKTGEAADPNRALEISWDASDPNHDTLVYRLYYKPHGGPDNWTPIVKDLKDSSYEWSTKSLPDGKYQVKVVASDSPDNSPEEAKSVARVSVPFVVDHTPPQIGDIKGEAQGRKNEAQDPKGEGAGGVVLVSGEAKDTLTPISDVRFQIDGAQDWQPAKASDKIFDSLSEAFTFTTRPLPPGPHRITVRVTDSAGNASYKAVNVTVK